MELEFEVVNLDAVDEIARGFYVEKDGKYQLSVKGIEDPTGLKSALQKERESVKNANKQALAWEKLGKSPDEINQILQEREEVERTKAEKAGEWDKLKVQMNEAHAKQLAEKDAKNQKMQKTLEYNLISAQATSAIAAAKGSTDLLLPHVERFVKVIEDGEQFRAVVVDEKGDPRVNGKGENLTIAELIEEMKQSDKYARAFDSSGQSGSGMQPNKQVPAGQQRGNIGGTANERKAALAAKFPNLPQR